jgi:TolB-like protein|nr:DUF799 superfamily outer membrane lipoprotein PelC [uncultured Acidithrix sp.]
MKWHKFLVPTTLLVMLAGCASMNIQAQQPLRPAAGTAWAVLPFANNTETPVANARAAALAAALLQSDGQRVLGTLPISSRLQTLLGGDWHRDYNRALTAARADGAGYALGGSVDQWSYRAGINAEPEVSLTLWVVDVPSGAVIWSGVGSAHGGSLGRSGTAAVAQHLIHRLLARALH